MYDVINYITDSTWATLIKYLPIRPIMPHIEKTVALDSFIY